MYKKPLSSRFYLLFAKCKTLELGITQITKVKKNSWKPWSKCGEFRIHKCFNMVSSFKRSNTCGSTQALLRPKIPSPAEKVGSVRRDSGWLICLFGLLFFPFFDVVLFDLFVCLVGVWSVGCFDFWRKSFCLVVCFGAVIAYYCMVLISGVLLSSDPAPSVPGILANTPGQEWRKRTRQAHRTSSFCHSKRTIQTIDSEMLT